MGLGTNPPRQRAVLAASLKGMPGGGTLKFTPDGRTLEGYDPRWDVSVDPPRELPPKQKEPGPAQEKMPEGQPAGKDGAQPLDPKWVAVLSPDGRIRVSWRLSREDNDWRIVFADASNGRKLRELQMPGPIRKVVFAPDGRHLLTENDNHTVYILRLRG